MTSPPVRIDPAVDADLPAVRHLEGLLPSTVRRLATDLGATDQVHLVARLADGEVVGYTGGLLQVDDGHVLDLAVARAYRRRGVGARLLGALVDALVGRGAGAVTLEVAAGNVGAQALYRRLGFVVEGRRPGYTHDGQDALLLWLRDAAAGRAEGR